MSLTVTAITFRMSDPGDGRTLSWALLCAETRYASTWWAGSPRADRRHLADWRNIEGEIALGLPAGPLPHDSAIMRLFSTQGRALVLQYVSAVLVTLERYELAATVLDARLQQLVLESVSANKVS